MKYGHEYSQVLASEDFPANWISAAVSYRDLKKCIKKIQQELSSLGLDAETLQHLASAFEVNRSISPSRLEAIEGARFVPELWIAVGRTTGRFLDAGLTRETKAFFLQRRSSSSISSSRSRTGDEIHSGDLSSLAPHGHGAHDKDLDVDWKQVPLSTVTTFFNTLDPKLAAQEELQRAESQRMDKVIVLLGTDVRSLTEPTQDRRHKYHSKKDVELWRKLFEMYIGSAVFFSSYEQDHGTRNYLTAKKQLQTFSDLLVKQKIVESFKSPHSRMAFNNFVQINLDILRVMRFQEINAVAVRKILKKFDKRTALGAARAYQSLEISGPFATSIAKDMCAELSTKVVSIVPQMDDYICPICCELAWRPIKLGCCNSVFCIRCVIKLQREGKDRCPMCRQSTIMAADSTCLDDDTAAYLMRYFPDEVKTRQKANERAAGEDRYGRHFYRSTCTMM